MAKRKTRRSKPRKGGGKFITHTTIEPKWMVKGRRTVKSLKRLMFNALAIVGFVVIVFLIARSF